MGVVIGMFFAFSGAGVANVGAKLHILLHKLRAPGLKATAKGADISAVAAELDAGGHVVVFTVLIAHFQAGSNTTFAGFGTLKAGISVAVSMSCSSHNGYWFMMKNKFCTSGGIG